MSSNSNNIKNIPEEINCTSQVFDIKFHPYLNFICVGLIDGIVNLYQYNVPIDSSNSSNSFNSSNSTSQYSSSNSNTINNKVLELKHHEGSSCRGIEFDLNGERLYTISSNRSWACIDNNGNIITLKNNSHLTPLNKCLILNENIFVTGDDTGCVKLWDIRVNTEIGTYHKHEDFITEFHYCSDNYTLLSTSGDSTLCTYDIRKKIPRTGAGDVVTMSDEQESEINCLEVIKDGRKVVCGTQEGVILTFSWGKWGDCTDRYPGHPHPVDCMLKIDENTILTGSTDGLIRVVGLQPNKIYGVLGDHDDFPVEGMSRSCDGLYLGTYSHDEVIRFWDMSMFVHDEGDEDDGNEDQNNDTGGDEETKGNNENQNQNNDEDEWESDNDDNDDDDMSEVENEDGEEEDDEEEAQNNNNNNNNTNNNNNNRNNNNDSDDSDNDSDEDSDSSEDNRKNKNKKNKKKKNNSNNSSMPPFRFPSNSKGRGFYSDMR